MTKVSEEKKVIAVIVTYNRKELLKECIEAILSQNYNNCNILVVDNASTDGTKEYIGSLLKNDRVIYRNTGSNLGGAGGFNYGIKEAYMIGCDFVWLMDDDTIVFKDSLQELIEASNVLDDEFGFLASTVVWKDKTPCIMNKQDIEKGWYKSSHFLKYGILNIKRSTFVSMLVPTKVINNVGLPIKEFFIWGDDMEYTNRISKKYKCYLAGKSQVLHKIKDNNGSNISKENGDRLSRYRYAYRNECYIARQNGIKGICRQFAKVNFNILRVLFTKNKYKTKKIWIIISSTIKGCFFNPKIEKIGENND